MTNKKAAQAGTRTASNKSNECQNSTPQKDLISDLYKVGGGYSVRFTFTPKSTDKIIDRFQCEWHPNLPANRDMRRKVSIEKYRSARNQFLEDVAKRMGGALLCISLGGDSHD